MWRRMVAAGLGLGITVQAAEPVWISSGSTPAVETTSAPSISEWKPVATTPAPAAVHPPVPTDSSWRPSAPVLVPVQFEVPVPPLPKPLPAPDAKETAPTPKVVPPPEPPKVEAPKLELPKIEPPKVEAPKVAPPISPLTEPVPTPLPAPKAAQPAPVANPPVITVVPPAGDESTAVWGAYNQPRTSTGTAAPMRHHTYGSPSLRLSRDYHVLDAFQKSPLDTDDGAAALAETAIQNDAFVSAEYLLWWVNNGNVPVLATTAAGQNFGFLGQPGTTLLLGPGPYGQTQRSGFRLRAGQWLDDNHSCGIDASLFVLGSVNSQDQISSDQFTTIARPFFAPNFGQEFAELVAFPGLASGRLLVEQSSFLWGADVNYRRCCGDGAEWFAGFRYLNLQETLTITEFITAGARAPDPAGTTIVVQDQFRAKNDFFGGQIGAQKRWQFENWSALARGSVALGVTNQSLSITGSQARTRPNQPTEFFTGGLLAAGPNLGTFHNQVFSVVPEATLNIGYNLRPNLRVFTGYNFLAWTGVLRPGDAIDRIVDLTYVPNAPNVPFSGQPRPQPQFNSSTLVVNGIQFGIEGSW